MNRKKFHKFTGFVSKNKLKLSRGYSYISVFMIPFLVSRELAKMSLFSKINWVWLYFFALMAVFLAGEIDWKWFWRNELEYSFAKNPEWVREMKKKELENE